MSGLDSTELVQVRKLFYLKSLTKLNQARAQPKQIELQFI